MFLTFLCELIYLAATLLSRDLDKETKKMEFMDSPNVLVAARSRGPKSGGCRRSVAAFVQGRRCCVS
jgi:hypothetical protein